MPNYKDVKNEIKKSYENYQGNANLLKSGQIDDADCEIVEIPASSLKYFNDIEDTFDQGETSIRQLKAYFSYGQRIYYAEMKKLLKELNLFKLFSSIEEMEKRYWKFVARLYQDGYNDYIVEFDNDISVRYQIVSCERYSFHPSKEARQISGDKKE